MQPQGAIFLATLALALIIGQPVSAGPFDRSPRQYAIPVNRILQQVGADFRLQRERCIPSPQVNCRFSSLHVAIEVRGRAVPPRIETITISADILQAGITANSLAAVTDIVLVFGATTVIFDPRLTPERRVQLLSDSMELALLTGVSEENGLDAHYALSFDQAAGGMFVIVVTPRH